MRPQPRVEVRAVRPPPLDVALDGRQRIAVLQARPHRRDQLVVAVLAPELVHPLDHLPAEPLSPATRGDHDLERAEDVGGGPAVDEARFKRRVDPAVGEAVDVSVPRDGNGVALADDLVPLVVPGVELELRSFTDQASEQPVEDRVVIHELGPDVLQQG